SEARSFRTGMITDSFIRKAFSFRSDSTLVQSLGVSQSCGTFISLAALLRWGGPAKQFSGAGRGGGIIGQLAAQAFKILMAINIGPRIDEHGLHAKLFQLVNSGGQRGGMAPLDSFQHADRTIPEADEIKAAVSGRAKHGIGGGQGLAGVLKISGGKARAVRAN